MKDENNENIGMSIEDINESVNIEKLEEFENNNVNATEEKGLINNKEEKHTKKKNNIALKITIVVVAIIVVLVMIVASFCIINKFNTNVYNNVYLGDKDMSGLNIDQVKKHVLDIYNASIGGIKVEVYQGEKLLDIVEPIDIDLKIDIDESINQLFNIGRTGNIVSNNVDILQLLLNKKVLNMVYNYDESKLKVSEESISSALDDKVVNDGYELDEKENKLIVIRGHKGNEVDKDKYNKEILKLLKAGKNARYDVVVKEILPKEINVEEVYNEVKRDAKDAYVVQNQGQKPIFNAEVYGYDFNKQDLKAVLDKEENKESDKKIVYDLKVTEPKIKYNDISWSAYEAKIGSLTTYFPAGNYNRAKNLQIALGYLDGIVIMPGETFSFNKAVGDVTAAKGYLPAATFKAGTVVNEIGGGICQTVSTLYNAALYANLEIVTRYQHALAVGYVKPSLDATMYYPNLDFKFKNNRNYPIKIVTSYSSNGSLNISIYGTKEDTEYEIVLTSNYLATIPYTTKYIDDPTLPAGTEKVKTNGSNGYKSEAYKITKLDGKTIKTELLSRDTYKATTKIVLRGTKGSTPPVVEKPVAPPTPSSGASTGVSA